MYTYVTESCKNVSIHILIHVVYKPEPNMLEILLIIPSSTSIMLDILSETCYAQNYAGIIIGLGLLFSIKLNSTVPPLSSYNMN